MRWRNWRGKEALNGEHLSRAPNSLMVPTTKFQTLAEGFCNFSHPTTQVAKTLKQGD
jgi:hypothetical protein